MPTRVGDGHWWFFELFRLLLLYKCFWSCCEKRYFALPELRLLRGLFATSQYPTARALPDAISFAETQGLLAAAAAGGRRLQARALPPKKSLTFNDLSSSREVTNTYHVKRTKVRISQAILTILPY